VKEDPSEPEGEDAKKPVDSEVDKDAQATQSTVFSTLATEMNEDEPDNKYMLL
jgi:hypothetical protein